VGIDWPLLVVFLGFGLGMTLFVRCLRAVVRRLTRTVSRAAVSEPNRLDNPVAGSPLGRAGAISETD